MPIPGVCYLCTMTLCAGKQVWPACCCCPWMARYSGWALNVVQTSQTRNSDITIFAYLAYIVSTWWSQEAVTVNIACMCMCVLIPKVCMYPMELVGCSGRVSVSLLLNFLIHWGFLVGDFTLCSVIPAHQRKERKAAENVLVLALPSKLSRLFSSVLNGVHWSSYVLFSTRLIIVEKHCRVCFPQQFLLLVSIVKKNNWLVKGLITESFMLLRNDSFPYASYKLYSECWTHYNLLLERLLPHIAVLALETIKVTAASKSM